jgi:hypothetical protein
MFKLIPSIIIYLSIIPCAMAGSTPQTGVSGSLHDINYIAASTGTYNQDSYQRVCVFCHTPHNAENSSSGVSSPLWNHAPSKVVLAPYVWALPANQTIPFNADPLIGPSRLCMGCHDGVTAVDSHGSSGSSKNGAHPMTTTGYTVNNLTKIHPIGFLYADALAARPGRLTDPTTTSFLASSPFGDASASSNVYTRVGYIPGTVLIASTLYAGYVTCATCHDVHNTNNAINLPDPNTGIAANYFVRAPEQGSALCLSCHLI